MNKKRTIVIAIILVIAMIISTISMILFDISEQKEEEISPGEIIDIEETETLDLTFMDVDTVDENQTVPESSYRVFLTNPNDLYESSLPSHGFGTFEGYLSRYIDYYLPSDEHYGVEFIVGSDDFHTIATNFLVKIPDLDITIKCIYKTSEKRYIFRSSLDDEE